MQSSAEHKQQNDRKAGGPPVNDDSAVAGSIPLWITACVRLMPPRRANGAELTTAVANTVFPAVQAFTAGHVDGQASAQLSRVSIARRCGLSGPKKLGWLFDYLELIGFLKVSTRYQAGLRGRRHDTFQVSMAPPSNYIGPRTSAELDLALEKAQSGHRPALFADVDGDEGHKTFVYVIGTSDHSSLKIGFTQDPAKRLSQLRNSSPIPLELLWCARGGVAVEQQLHSHFHRYRGHGEWFDFGPQGDPVNRIRTAAMRFGAVEVSA